MEEWLAANPGKTQKDYYKDVLGVDAPSSILVGDQPIEQGTRDVVDIKEGEEDAFFKERERIGFEPSQSKDAAADKQTAENILKEKERDDKLRANRGRSSTILTSPFGVQGGSPFTAKKTLLGA